MVEDCMGVQLNKEKLLAWLVRPLAENYLQYAMEDVLYLIPCYNKLLKELAPEQFAEAQTLSNKLIELNQPQYLAGNQAAAEENFKIKDLALSSKTK